MRNSALEEKTSPNGRELNSSSNNVGGAAWAVLESTFVFNNSRIMIYKHIQRVHELCSGTETGTEMNVLFVYPPICRIPLWRRESSRTEMINFIIFITTSDFWSVQVIYKQFHFGCGSIGFIVELQRCNQSRKFSPIEAVLVLRTPLCWLTRRKLYLLTWKCLLETLQKCAIWNSEY